MLCCQSWRQTLLLLDPWTLSNTVRVTPLCLSRQNAWEGGFFMCVGARGKWRQTLRGGVKHKGSSCVLEDEKQNGLLCHGGAFRFLSWERKSLQSWKRPWREAKDICQGFIANKRKVWLKCEPKTLAHKCWMRPVLNYLRQISIYFLIKVKILNILQFKLNIFVIVKMKVKCKYFKELCIFTFPLLLLFSSHWLCILFSNFWMLPNSCGKGWP